MNDINRASRNRDYLKRLNYPRQTYAFTGIDWGDADTNNRPRKKLAINGAPMLISPMPPGAMASSDVSWSQVYGASMDSVMALVDGSEYDVNIVQSAFEFPPVISEAIPTANSHNIYQVLDGKQQIQFVVGKPTVKEFRDQAATKPNPTPLLPSEQRSLGMRAPIQMCGWGATIGMRPTDPEPQFDRRNDNEHKFDRSTWKVGPLDARWDERRRCWRAFNDLIVDNQSQNLGTLVFGTNPDTNCGFPFLRGKLEDVWEVRRTFREIGTEVAAKNDDVTKSALVTTKLNSYAYQANKVAPWSDVLTLFDTCIEGSPLNATCGSETTSEAFMGIQTAAYFVQSQLQAGPIVFNTLKPDDVITGGMYYEGTGPCGAWVPGIAVDICEIGNTEFGLAVENDIAIAEAICDLLTALFGTDAAGGIRSVKNLRDKIREIRGWIRRNADYGQDHATESAEGFDATSNGFTKIQEWTVDILGQINETILRTSSALVIGLMQSVEIGLNDLQTRIYDSINALVTQIAAAFASCECEWGGFQPDPTPITLSPPQSIRPNIKPPLDLEPEIAELDDSVDNIQPLDKLYDGIKTEIDNANADEDDSAEDGEPSFTVEVKGICDNAGKKVSC